MKIYTKTGDAGSTSLIGARTSKAALRVDTYGEIDTLNSLINVVISLTTDYNEYLTRISNFLFKVGHDIANIDNSKAKVDQSETLWLEESIDSLDAELKDFNHFILPGGTLVASHLHVCRTQARKCERKIVSLNENEDLNQEVMIYINRLSDFLYTLACVENVRHGKDLIKVTI